MANLLSTTITGNLTVDTNVLYVDSANNRVGIGTTSPDSTLYISTVGSAALKFSRTGSSVYGFEIGGTTFGLWDYTASTYKWRTSGSNVLIAESIGNVGIGTTSPATSLDVNGTISSGGSPIAWFSGNYNRIYRPNGTVGIYLGNSSDEGNYYDNTTHYFRSAAGGTNRMIINSSGNVLIGTTTDAGYKLDVNGSVRGTSIVKSGGTSLQYLKADGSVDTVTAATDFVRYGDFVNYPAYAGKTVTMHPSIIKTLLWGGENIRYTVTNTYTGTYPQAGSTWVRTYELIDGTASVYSTGTIYCGFWNNNPPANITVRVQNTSGTWYGPYQGSEVGVGYFEYWKIPCGGPNHIKVWEITFTPTPGASINLQTVDIVIDNNEGIDQTPFVGRGGSSIYGTLSFKGTGSATTAYINNSGVIGGLYLRPSDNSGMLYFQNSGGTTAGSMFMDGSIWRFKSQNSTDTFNIFANGNLGIKQTTDAGYTVDINGTTNFRNATYFGNGGVGYITWGTINSNYALNLQAASGYFLNFGTNGSTGRMVIDTSGNVGIGTTSPSALLSIQRSTETGEYFRGSGLGNSAELRWFSISSATTSNQGDTHILNAQSVTGEIVFANNNGTERVRINSSGNVGIGTTSPTKILTISASSQTWAGAPQVAFYDTVSGQVDARNWTVGAISTNYGNFTIASSTVAGGDPTNARLTISKDGNVGIGTTNPAQKLHVVGNTVTTGVAYTDIVQTWLGTSIDFRHQDASVVMRVDTANARVGIGTTSPGYALEVIGTAKFGDGSPFLKVTSSSVDVEGAYLFAAYQGGVSFYAYDSVFRGLIRSDSSGGNVLKLGDTQERMRIVGGNVLIGTTTDAGYKLDVNGDVRLNGNTTSIGYLQTYGLFYHRSNFNVLNKAANGWLTWVTRNTSEAETTINLDYVRSINASGGGNVGIGTTSPSEKLHVSGAAIFDGGAGDSSTDSVVYITKSNNNDWGLYVNNAGLDYGMYTRTSPSAVYAFAIHDGTAWTTRITGDGRLYLNEKDTIASYDTWLRLNQSAHYTSGVFTPGVMRADGGFNVNGSTVWHAGNDGSGSGLDADLLDGQDSSVFLRQLSGGTEASLDTYTDNGVRAISFTGHSQHLLSWNAGGSTGTIQQLFHYDTPNNGWKIRNKTDNNIWSTWGYVVMASSNQGLISGTIATQSWVGSQSYATQTYVNTAVANLVDSAPSTLDTLNELAAALGDDPNFATTVTNSIAAKQAQLNGTGFVKVSGTTVSYDNSTYLTSYTETDTLATVTNRGATATTNITVQKAYPALFLDHVGSGTQYGGASLILKNNLVTGAPADTTLASIALTNSGGSLYSAIRFRKGTTNAHIDLVANNFDTTDLRVATSGNVLVGTTTDNGKKLQVNGDASINGINLGRGPSNSITNTVLGYTAYESNVNGTYNTAIGRDALWGNTTGDGNTALGAYALGGSESTNNNTGIGQSALGSLWQTGDDNTAVGNAALGWGYDMQRCTAVGAYALVQNDADYNTALGYYAGFSNVSGTGNLFLGYQAGQNETGSNKLYISNSSTSNLIYGDFSTKYLGFGTTSPGAFAHIKYSSASIAGLLIENDGVGYNAGSLTLRSGTSGGMNMSVTSTGGMYWYSLSNSSNALSLTSSNNLIINGAVDNGKKLQVNGDVFIKGSTSSSAYADSIFEVQNSNGTSIMDFRGDAYAFFGCGQGGGAASGFIFRYNDTAHVQFTGYNYGNGAGSYKPLLFDTDLVGRSQGVYVNFGGTGYANPAPISSTEFAVRGRTSDATENVMELRDSNNTEKFVVKNDGAIVTNGNMGWSGTVSFPTNPPGQQNLEFTNGILTNVF